MEVVLSLRKIIKFILCDCFRYLMSYFPFFDIFFHFFFLFLLLLFFSYGDIG